MNNLSLPMFYRTRQRKWNMGSYWYLYFFVLDVLHGSFGLSGYDSGKFINLGSLVNYYSVSMVTCSKITLYPLPPIIDNYYNMVTKNQSQHAIVPYTFYQHIFSLVPCVLACPRAEFHKTNVFCIAHFVMLFVDKVASV